MRFRDKTCRLKIKKIPTDYQSRRDALIISFTLNRSITMATSSGTDIQELKEFIGDRFNELKLEMSEIKGEIKVINKEIEGINRRLSSLETSVQKIPDLAEKVGEFKNWKQIGVLLLASIFSGTIGSFIGWIARSGKI